jgi:hypothetical protein
METQLSVPELVNEIATELLLPEIIEPAVLSAPQLTPYTGSEGVFVAAAVAVFVGGTGVFVRVGVDVAVLIRVAVGVGVFVRVAVAVGGTGVFVRVGVDVAVLVRVGVAVGGTSVFVRVAVGVSVLVRVGAGVFLRVGVGVGEDAIAPAALTRPQPVLLSKPATSMSVAVDKSRLRIWFLSVMPAEIINPTTPATCGDANDVPLPVP